MSTAQRQAPLSAQAGDDGTPQADPVATLWAGELKVEGRLVDASNATLFCRAVDAGAEVACVYKPVAGERPLWDFPPRTLAAREVAAYAVSEATGWSLVPPTLLRDGPFGRGMCQLWVEEDPARSYVDVVRRGRLPPGWLEAVEAFDEAGRVVSLIHADDDDLRHTAIFDVVINNADRKGAHLLPVIGGGLRVVDHGVCFHVEPKLRTVLWGWAGAPLHTGELQVLRSLEADLDGALGETLGGLLSEDEVAETHFRVQELLEEGVLPERPTGWRSLPWPPI